MTEKPVLIAATGNLNKLRELREILGEQYDILSMKEAGVIGEAEENGISFEENAVLKAVYVMEQTGKAAIADDSGLEVDALGGAPGIYSARYCGHHGDDEANNDLLLERLANIPAPRTARYHAAVALVCPGRKPVVGHGSCEGEILFDRRGNGGFGYDPLFLCELGKTFAEVTDQEKNSISHRKRAIADLQKKLEDEA